MAWSSGEIARGPLGGGLHDPGKAPAFCCADRSQPLFHKNIALDLSLPDGLYMLI